MRQVRLSDVAEHAGVSMKTVSNVVRGYVHVSESTRNRVQSAIDELGYRPNIMARRLATGRTGLIALAFADVGIPYFAELARVVSRAAQERGYRVLLQETDATLEGERAVVASSESGLVDGILFQPSRMSMTEIARHRTEVPLVLLGEAPAPLTVDHVRIDNIAAADDITSHVLAEGRRRIAFVGHERSSLSETSRQRITGYQQALERHGIAADPELLIASDEISASGAEAAVGAALVAGLEVDALVCRDDLAAIGALRALQVRGRRIPHDVVVTGWDDIRISGSMFPSLTTVSPDLAAIASSSLELLEQRIDGFDGAGRHRIAPYAVRVRESAP